MQYDVTLSHEDGEYIAECPAMSLAARGLSPTNALDSLKEEIRYRLELCPCTSVNEDFVELNIQAG
ncbi:MAG TPA: hypothetical protein PKE55_14740 [Kiritimatiellia bacterium]|nr:hypothetical protein [Kiritimatiellia bacterium]